MASSDQEPIAVIGMACRFPGGSNSPSKLWELIRDPKNLSKKVPTARFDSTAYFHQNGSYHGATDSQQAYFLEQDIARFDNGFFNIQPAEAEAIDPQQRLLMETVYDSLCAGGQTIEQLRGTDTAVYVGMMCDDWAQLINRDWEATQTYAATGESRAILSNRVSYYFDWHGPSMTVDTACSSSLVAVHQGVTSLRNGECPVAIAAGANLILGPGMWIAESKLHMLSPTGTSKMWDASADGYARGEGVAAVVMKKLSDAIRDGDPIECIIRGSGVNQDGRTPGLTMPSNSAQAKLIRDTYLRAGLDINDPKDRPQFFHAHGTGTQAGDPQEAQAISSSFFGDGKPDEVLAVGSIKTIIGHTEGSAGLASLIGSALALKHATIPPNLHFSNLSPKVAPFYTNLKIPTAAIPWPKLLHGQPRRVSVNSFGFGGTNSHAILESYEPALGPPEAIQSAAGPAFTPLTISASSASALKAMLLDLRDHLEANPATSMRDLAYTLQNRRSTLAYRKTIIAGTVEEAISRIDGLVGDNDAAAENGLNTRYLDVGSPGILGVFTGQGAQWARMGAKLIEQSPYVASRIDELDRALANLPEGDRPDWTLRQQLLADSKASRLSKATIAQPLCTAVQIVLVDLLKPADIPLKAVVGHSSGEIGAAYAAGFLTATNALYIAYYRGRYAHLAGSDGGVPGAMLAVGTSYEDALDFCNLDDFVGRIQVAARNSSTSVTLSGDEDAVDEAEAIFRDENVFARKLRVDTAYHSYHMLPCAKAYLDALTRAKITVQEGNGIPWFSSVDEDQIMTKDMVSQSQYWVDNMTNPVLFAPAISSAVTEAGPFDLVIEFGPHPALKGPALDTVEEACGKKIPYTGLLARGKDDKSELSLALGFMWMNLGPSSVNFDAFERQISGVSGPKSVISLPTYPFDHSRRFYSLTRFSGSSLNAHAPPHPILGRRSVETESESQVSWRQLLKPNEISWLQGHQLQGQSVFPAMGYVAMALEAASAVAGPERKLGMISLEDVVIGRALTFGNDDAGMECRVTLHIERNNSEELRGKISCHSGLPYDSATPLALNFSGTIGVAFHEPRPDTLPVSRILEINLGLAETERLYSQFTMLGYNYSSPFTGVRSIQRKMDFATGELEDEAGDDWEDQLLVHPGLLDSAIQTGFAAYAHPHDNRLWALHVPTSIRSVTVNPYYFSNSTEDRSRSFQYQTATRVTPEIPMVVDIGIFSGDSDHPFVQFDSVGVKPFAAATARDDAPVFSRIDYRMDAPDVMVAIEGPDTTLRPENTAMLLAAERVGFYHLHRLHEAISDEEKEDALPHYRRLLDYAARIVCLVSEGNHPTVPKEALNDSTGYVRSLMAKNHQHVFIKLLGTVGKNLEEAVRTGGDMMECMTKDGLLDQFYQALAGPQGSESANTWCGRLLRQITFRYPRMNILEIGSGTGAATSNILSALNGEFETYTFTDVSDEGFSAAQTRFQKFSDRMAFSKYDMDKAPGEQGFEEESYDVVLAAAALHAGADMEKVMANARRLVKPGGYLIVGDIISNDFLSISTILGCLPEWWAGAEVDPSQANGPCLSVDQWGELATRNGFAGIETHSPVDNKLQYYSVFACQAVDDRVLRLRDPIGTHIPNASAKGHLVVVGGRKSSIGKLATETIALISELYESITQVVSLEELHAVGLEPGTSVLSLAELDQQFLENHSAVKLDALKNLWRHGRSILYVTQGARNDSPYSAMVLGVSRCVRFEQPNINMQVLDFATNVQPNAKALAESLIRLELGYRWFREEDGVKLLWSMEPEVYHTEDKILIPRCLPLATANDRYNTCRRAVHVEVNPTEETVVLDASLDGKTFELSTPSPLRVLPTPRTEKTVAIKVRHSLLYSIRIQEAGFFAIAAGEDAETGETLVTLLDTATESVSRAPVEWTTKSPANTSAVLSAIAGQLVSQSILAAATPHHGTIVVHEADETLKDALAREAAAEGVEVMFTTASRSKAARQQYVFVHSKLPIRLVQTLLLPRQISLLVNLAPGCGSAELLSQCMPLNTPTHNAADFVRARPGVEFGIAVQHVRDALEAAARSVSILLKQKRRTNSDDNAPVIPLQSVAGHPTTQAQLSVVDWNTASVNVLVRSIDHGTIFRADATYLLFGLAGELGQSLCNWMVLHGARHILIGSRRPNVSPQFIERLADQGADVRVMTVDVCDRDSLYKCYNTVTAEMPAVAGVANGALVLADSLFDEMTYEDLDRTFGPKVEGTMLLDELFYDAPLDFFIPFTSAVGVSGNTGQSAYIMANNFMTSLAAQRRDVRGVAGSDLALGAMSGLGAFERSATLDKDHFSKMGYRDSSEHDFLQLFGEAILAGKPENAHLGVSQVASGLKPVRNAPEVQAQLREDPKFSHFILPDATAIARQGGGGSGKSARPRVRLASAKSQDEARSIVKDAFIERLKRVLMIPQDEPLNEDMTFVEQGLDSIMAVEVRTWFLSEVEVDLPVLQILGAGSTVQAVVNGVMDKIPASILNWDKLGNSNNSDTKLATPAAPAVPDVPGAPPAVAAVVAPKAIELPSPLPFSPISRSGTIASPALSRTETMTSYSLSRSGTMTPAEAVSTPGTSVASQNGLSRPGTPLKSTTTAEERQQEALLEMRKQLLASSSEHVELMTYGQRRMWFLTHYVEDPTTFNISFMAKLQGKVRLKDMAKAVESVSQRHESLRTRFFWSDDAEKRPMQGIISKSVVRLETAQIANEEEAHIEHLAMYKHQWDFGDWAAVRLRLLSVSNTEHYMLMGSHHISLDGHSFTVMMMDIERAYNSPNKRIPQLPDSSQARAFSEKQRITYESGTLKPSIEAYRKMLPAENLVRPIDLFPFAKTQVRPPLDSYDTHIAQRLLPASVVAKLNQIARGRRATSFHAYLAGLQSLVMGILPADTTDKVIIGMADANRLDSKFMGSVGNFLNVLPLRFDRPTGHQTFGDAVADARAKAYGALAHSALPFDQMLDELAVPRSNSWSPVFQIFVDYRLVPSHDGQRSWAGCKVSDESWHTAKSGYDVVLEIKEDAGETSMRIHVQKALYDESAAELLLNSYVNLLSQAAKQGDKVETRKLDKWDQSDVRKALDIGRGPDMKLEWPATVAHRIEDMTAQHPDSIAIKDGRGAVLTYAAMDQRVESIASALREQLALNEDAQQVVGVFQMPTGDFICSLLAIHRAGAIYLPLDLRNGTPRLASNVNAARPVAILTDDETAHRTNELEASENVALINVTTLPIAPAIATEKREIAATADSAAYIIFTSGSTGEAKGIVVSHGNLRANLEGYHREWDVANLANVMLQQAAFSFDASLLQIYAPLTTGGCLLVVPADARGDPQEVTRLMIEHGVTMTQATPSEYDMWFRFAPENVRKCKSWKAAWFGGERAGAGLLSEFRNATKALPNLKVYTSYGPTETTISAMKAEADVRDPALRVPVPGRLLPNYSAYIVDENMKPVPLGVSGEIVLGGAGVGRNEYLNKPELTAQTFLPDTFSKRNDNNSARMYRTGDAGRLRKDGFLAIEGRIAGDTQVKLRGFRIELAEIERVMIKESNGALTHAVVTLHSNDGQEPFLSAHIVIDANANGNEKAITETDLVDKLRARLPLVIPPYMCPAVIVPVDNMPLTAHQKVDRLAVQGLPIPQMEAGGVDYQLHDFTSAERRLASLWAQILPPHETLTQRSDFFLVGGNSLVLVQLQAAIRREFGDAPRLNKLMGASGLASMASLLEGLEAVDWEKEMHLDLEGPAAPRRVPESQGRSVLVTGATGHLGQRIVMELAENKSVSRIIALVRPVEGRVVASLFTGLDKVSVVSTDLTSITSFSSELFDVDTVLHCASNRTFWDSYTAAKPVNVDTVKALAQFCHRTGAGLHILSSGATAEHEADGESGSTRPNSGDGYISSKWVAERYLAKAARVTGIDVTVHRPTQVVGDALVPAGDELTEAEATMGRALLLGSPLLGIQPDFSHIHGWMDVALLTETATAIVSVITAEEVVASRKVRIVNHPGIARVRTAALAKYTEDSLEEADETRKLPIASGLHFVGAAKRAGLFGWVITAQEITMTDDNGQKIVSRR
ncbi:Acyl transferase/acyl hydrolase/lysophospholipase [Penicillium italicum]|uniref:Acyl transferase/acyl hydrolase/lysophospholipase n=1 Tax=Penicillium italicum TaxID=40296 RepID=A0A0A2LE33_PENIT|nr:Acyl transferase/acyl hydrolase/lysophospholipase [Penicillium italicum]